jgi:glycogen(starch) synthase
MNLLFWADGFWPRIGGTETQGLQFVEAMQNRGHRCMVIAQRDPFMMKEESYRGVLIKRFDFNALIKHPELKLICFLKEFLESVVDEFHPDLVYLNTLANGSVFAFLLFRNLFSIATVATAHAPYYGDTLPPLVEKICLQIDQICCTSKWGYGEMKKFLPGIKDKLRLIPCGLSVPLMAPTSLPFSPPTILLLGRLSSEKGFEIGVEAFARLKASGSNARLLIAGEGDELPFLQYLVSKLGLKDFVQFTGGLPRDGDAVFSVINQATFVVMPSRIEAFGLVSLESMRMGRPLIASNVGGLPEIVSDGETGLLVPPADSIQLCAAMQILLKQPKKTIEMGERARKWAMSVYLLEENVDRYEELFNQLMPSFR